MEMTLAIIKPDGVKRGLVGAVLGRIEDEGLRVIAMKMVQLDRAAAEGFYAVHKGKAFFEGLVQFMTEGPIVVMILEGEDAVPRWRTLMGATNPEKADPGTIRRDLAESMTRNVAHGSDASETAAFETCYFFNALERFGA